MRDIKFRGKRKDNGEWVYGDLMTGDSWSEIHNNSGWWLVDPSTVGQFTGLTDKNGTEIYEGDVLSRKEWGMGGPHDPEERCEVQYLDYYIKEGEHSGHFNIELWSEWCEVIGNIHDNPNLLESEG